MLPVEPVSATAPDLPRPRLMRQRWCDLTFLHWAVEPDVVAPLLPPGTRPDVHDGRTHVGLIPFRMVGAGFGHGPPVPWAGTFLETNVRLYSVDHTGRHGVVFRSLDASRAVVVAGARAVFGLPYRWAAMRHTQQGDVHTYTARLRRPDRPSRSDRQDAPHSRIAVRVGAETEPAPLSTFLTARWGLHTAHLGRTWFVPNAHPTWSLHAAELLELDDDLVAAAGFSGLTGRPPDHVAFSRGVPVAFGRPSVLPPLR